MMRKLAIPIFLLIISLIVVGCSPTQQTTGDLPGDSVPAVPEPQVPQPELPAAFMVMVDNHSGARPQHGLTKADIVYEIVCETGITRLLAGFYTQDPGFVGPIRSIRYYYLHVAKAYNLPLAHVGGNMDAMELRSPLGIKSICDITNASGAFYTDSKRRRPHSTYIKSSSVQNVADKRGYARLALPELPEGDFVGTQAVSEVQISYSSNYKVSWVYQPEEEQYNRLLNGSPFPTAEPEAITTKNIIIIEAPVKTVQVPVDGVQSQINLIGQGKALFLRDGQLASGTWRKDKPEAHFKYTLDDGTELKFAPGNVWVQQVNSLLRDTVTK